MGKQPASDCALLPSTTYMLSSFLLRLVGFVSRREVTKYSVPSNGRGKEAFSYWQQQNKNLARTQLLNPLILLLRDYKISS